MRGLDLSKFKKIDSDSKCTILQHADGHELKIAHSSLSKQNKVALDKLPKMARGGMVKNYAEGGDSQVVEQADSNKQQAPVVINVGAQTQQPQIGQPEESKAYPVQQDQAQAKTAYTYTPEDEAYLKSRGMPLPENASVAKGMDQQPASVAPAEMQAPPEEVAQAPQEGRAPAGKLAAAPPQEPAQEEKNAQQEMVAPEQAAAPNLGQSAPQDNTYQKSYDEYKQAHQQQFAQEDAAFAQDLRSGHITPETYSSLFAKKDTLGKIGTIFGLMLGSLSGVKGGNNALLEAMNQQIQNDLQAQMKSKENAQNYLKINQAQQMQEASIENLKKTGQLTEAQAKSMEAEAGLKAYTLANVQANRVALENQVKMVDKMKEGPEKEKARQLLAMMGMSVNAENARLSDIASSKLALLNSSMMGQGGNGSEGQFQKNQNFLRFTGNDKIAEHLSNTHIPGVGQASGPVSEGKRNEIEAMNTLDYKVNDILDFAKAHKGTLSPSQRKVGEQKAEELVNYYNSSIKGGVLTEGRLKWLDEQIKKNPTSIFQDILGNNSRLKEIRDSNAERRNILLKNIGAPTMSHAPKEDSSPQYKTVGGVKYMRGPNGEAIKVK